MGMQRAQHEYRQMPPESSVVQRRWNAASPDGVGQNNHTLKRREPGARIVVLEKEDRPGRHSSGRNSGVLHSGIYYPPASLKARPKNS